MGVGCLRRPTGPVRFARTVFCCALLLVPLALASCSPRDASEPVPAQPAAPAPAPESPSTVENDLSFWEGAVNEEGLALPIRQWAIEQVARHPDPRAVQILVGLLSDPNMDVVRAAATGLSVRSEPEARAALLELRAHHDPEITRLVGAIAGGGA